MDPLRLVLRCVLTYVFLFLLLRLAGKRTIRQGPPFDFVLAVVISDLVDAAIRAEVPFIQFVVAAATLVLTKLVMTWRRGVASYLDAPRR